MSLARLEHPWPCPLFYLSNWRADGEPRFGVVCLCSSKPEEPPADDEHADGQVDPALLLEFGRATEQAVQAIERGLEALRAMRTLAESIEAVHAAALKKALSSLPGPEQKGPTDG